MNDVVRVAPAQGYAEALMKLITDPNIPAEKLEIMLKMRQELVATQALEEFNAAYVAMSSELPQVQKDGTVILTKEGKGYKYARWEDMDALLRPIYTKHGFSFSFFGHGNPTMITGELLHVGGHVRTSELPLVADQGPGRNPLQAMGSGLSYTKRYLAEMLLNIVRKGEDDDGVGAGGGKIKPEQAAQLAALISEVNSTPASFLKAMVSNCERLEDVLAVDYVRLVNVLNQKKQNVNGNGNGKKKAPK